VSNNSLATVRVFVPTYRRPLLLPRPLESLRAQTFTDWVCEVRTDDPNDSFPGKLIQRLGDPRIELRNHERTVGRMYSGASFVLNGVTKIGGTFSINTLPQDSMRSYSRKLVTARGIEAAYRGGVSKPLRSLKPIEAFQTFRTFHDPLFDPFTQ
jgi:hypothetical protein